MARKFKIRDTVEVVKDFGKEGEKLLSEFRVGHRGVVINYDSDYRPYSYEVKRKNGNTQYFNVKELKLIRKGT